MLKEKIKNNLHAIIDDVKDDYILNQINDVVNSIIENKKLKWDSLSEAEKDSILTGLRQLENGEYDYYDDIKKSVNSEKIKSPRARQDRIN